MKRKSVSDNYNPTTIKQTRSVAASSAGRDARMGNHGRLGYEEDDFFGGGIPAARKKASYRSYLTAEAITEIREIIQHSVPPAPNGAKTNHTVVRNNIVYECAIKYIGGRWMLERRPVAVRDLTMPTSKSNEIYGQGQRPHPYGSHEGPKVGQAAGNCNLIEVAGCTKGKKIHKSKATKGVLLLTEASVKQLGRLKKGFKVAMPSYASDGNIAYVTVVNKDKTFSFKQSGAGLGVLANVVHGGHYFPNDPAELKAVLSHNQYNRRKHRGNYAETNSQ